MTRFAMIELLFIYQLARNPVQAVARRGGAAACSAPRAADGDARNAPARDAGPLVGQRPRSIK
jgi:hypothetical protein